MHSIILRTATVFLKYLLLVFSVYLLLGGHNEPGGGFVGGLVAASAFILFAIAYNVEEARKRLRIEPAVLIGIGLLTALFSGLIPVILNKSFLTGVWFHGHSEIFGDIHIGSPLFFDVGVYLVVLGVTVKIIFSLLEEV